jgi:pimeloyl-ACP methyl ester carboxylesterase
MNDLQWSGRGDAGHGAALAEGLGALPVYFRYNSGLAVERNGGLLSEALTHLLRTLPQPPARITLIGHSMGGLVARSAELQARQANHPWRPALSDLVLLGTPNEGAPLERLGRAFQSTLARIPYARHFGRIGALRSRGILDLGEGRVHRDAPAPLPDDLRCLAVAAQLGKVPSRAAARWLGDGLVPVDSAFGRSALGRGADRELLVAATGHLQLLKSEEVRSALIAWLR